MGALMEKMYMFHRHCRSWRVATREHKEKQLGPWLGRGVKEGNGGKRKMKMRMMYDCAGGSGWFALTMHPVDDR